MLLIAKTVKKCLINFLCPILDANFPRSGKMHTFFAEVAGEKPAMNFCEFLLIKNK
jgi:hypothetical protein